MSTFRQSRAIRDRRHTSRNAPPIIPDVSWRVNTYAGNTVNLTLGDVVGELILNGVPDFVASPAGEHASGATLAWPDLAITFPSAQLRGSPLQLLALDPALRTSLGGFLVAGISDIPIPPVPAVAEVGPNQQPTAQITRFAIADNGGIVNVPDTAEEGEWLWIENNANGSNVEIRVQTSNDLVATLETLQGAVCVYSVAGGWSGTVFF